MCNDCSKNLCEQVESGDHGGKKVKVGSLPWANELSWILFSAHEGPAFPMEWRAFAAH